MSGTTGEPFEQALLPTVVLLALAGEACPLGHLPDRLGLPAHLQPSGEALRRALGLLERGGLVEVEAVPAAGAGAEPEPEAVFRLTAEGHRQAAASLAALASMARDVDALIARYDAQAGGDPDPPPRA